MQSSTTLRNIVDFFTDYPVLTKILFICGCVEPGKSGVGDYTLLLAREIASSTGKAPCILALNDEFVSEVSRKADSVNPIIEIHRIPKGMKSASVWKTETQRIIDAFDPQWISLQYVGYAYSQHGLPNSLSKLLGQISTEAKLHIMFHELWEGFGVKDGLKQRLRGYIQKFFVEQLLYKHIPDICHTQNYFYLGHLKQLVHDAAYLPLFGNIKIYPPDPDAAWQIIQSKLPKARKLPGRQEMILFAFFGSIYPGWERQVFLQQIEEVQRQTGKSILILSLGHLGGTILEWHALKEKVSEGIDCIEIGFLDESEISYLLQEIDYGLATTPFEALGKSGSFVTMQEHGKIVFGSKGMLRKANFDGVEPAEPNARAMNKLKETILNPRGPLHFGSRLSQTAHQMLEDLEHSSCEN